MFRPFCFRLSSRDHPREYGENGFDVYYRRLGYRIIPANTGRIVPGCGIDALSRDHPREYGENNGAYSDHDGFPGSSPRIRGEFLRRAVLALRLGIIPANTGRMNRGTGEQLYGGIIPANTGRIGIVLGEGAFFWDHPREYGENKSLRHFHASMLGSSPRIRGESQAFSA